MECEYVLNFRDHLQLMDNSTEFYLQSKRSVALLESIIAGLVYKVPLQIESSLKNLEKNDIRLFPHNRSTVIDTAVSLLIVRKHHNIDHFIGVLHLTLLEDRIDPSASRLKVRAVITGEQAPTYYVEVMEHVTLALQNLALEATTLPLIQGWYKVIHYTCSACNEVKVWSIALQRRLNRNGYTDAGYCDNCNAALILGSREEVASDITFDVGELCSI